MRYLILLVFTLTSPLFADPPKWKLDTDRLDPPTELADAIKRQLGPDTASVSDESGTLLTLWFRSELTSTANADQVKNGLTYRELAEGTLLGVVKLEKAFIDFRKQEIPAGAYTLRLAVQPDTGDHKDTAPHQDFALLAPAAADTSTEPVEVKELVKMSLKSTGGDHPGVMLLFPHSGKNEKPELKEEKDGIKVVRVRRPIQAGEIKATFGLSIVVAGVSKMR
jgi:hypothetical protein